MKGQPDMTSQEPLVGKVTTETIPREQLEQLETMSSQPPAAAEVSGRRAEVRLARCSNCGYTGWISFDPAATCSLRLCTSCGAVLIF
jgi:hypothetical protein